MRSPRPGNLFGDEAIMGIGYSMIEDSYDLETLRTAPPDVQRKTMEDWFRQRFEDPNEGTTYESELGGYLWIWVGPYDADEELQDQFQGVVPDEVIEELVTSLERECVEATLRLRSWPV